MHNKSNEYKQMNSQTISWNDSWILFFICLLGRLLEPSASSFLIQMLGWIRGSSRVESFVFLIAWGIFFWWWELDLQFLLSSYESSFFFFWKSAKSNHFLLAQIPRMNESHDPGRPFKVAITTSAFFTSSFTASICSFDLRDPRKV